MSIQVIFFDYDYTLGDRETAAYHTYADILRRYTNISDPIEFEALVQNCMIYDQHGDVNKNYVKQRLIENDHLSIDVDDFDELWIDTLWKYSKPYPDTIDTLEKLKAKYRLAVITNGASSAQRKKLEVTGIASYFEQVIVSGDDGYAKPDKRIFQKALDLMHVKAEESVMVGDTFGKDILGAYRVGIHPVWIVTDSKKESHTGIKTIHALSELIPYLEKLDEKA